LNEHSLAHADIRHGQRVLLDILNQYKLSLRDRQKLFFSVLDI